MSALLHKEYLVNRQIILITATILIIGGLITADSYQISIFLPVLFGAIQPFSDAKNEDISRIETLVNSLPTTRKKIVLSKYLFAIIVITFYLTLVISINAFVPTFEPNTALEILSSGAAAVFFISLYYPLFYLLGPRFLSAGMSVLAFITLAVIFPLLNIGARNNFWGIPAYLNNFSTIQLTLGILVISATITISSFLASASLYKKKNF